MTTSTYKTSDIAKLIGIHPNTVRLYEEWGFIPKAERMTNGYRIFTEFHLEQLKLARMALNVEILQNGLRKEAINIIKTSASGQFVQAIDQTAHYLRHIKTEQSTAEESITIAEQLLLGDHFNPGSKVFTRKETADALHISIDALRNWEMNGLLTIKRKQNGYRIYTEEDIRRLKIIRSLRMANYSLSAILRMLNAFSRSPEANLRQIIDTPEEGDDIISVCDKLITSLHYAEQNAKKMLGQLEKMRQQFATNPPL
ncbi:MerR family transcriptional regulator [uncultured Paenibacillus sp.]|uniref:MerR family transcriptional regulator n=1 Tax=uncultured Paenibacillus sp. TaxID=227322 RepID=UPI002804CF71|nr:MerR family transcriptional regulator [uncultured Paenibacillus sp.]